MAKFSKECRGGWAVDVDLEQEGAPYNISNKNAEGVKQFYEVVPGKYGNPIIIAEPDLAFEAPESVDYIDAEGEKIPTPTERIAGIICKQAEKVMERFSLSSPNKPDYELEEGGASLIIAGLRWHLHTLFSKDKNRIIGFDGYYRPEKPKSVKVLELEDLNI